MKTISEPSEPRDQREYDDQIRRLEAEIESLRTGPESVERLLARASWRCRALSERALPAGRRLDTAPRATIDTPPPRPSAIRDRDAGMRRPEPGTADVVAPRRARRAG